MNRGARPARRGGSPGGPDRQAMRRATALFIEAIPEPGLRHDMRRTPARVAEAWSRELLSGYRSEPATILATGVPSRERGLVLIRDIPFVSICVHHLLPFHGTAHVAYLPAGRLVGLSKISRTVDALSRRLQLQERLTRQIVEAIEGALGPAGAACRIDAEHLCMTIRGARKRGSRVITTAYVGRFERNAALRSEFLRLSAPGEPSKATRSRRRRSGA